MFGRKSPTLANSMRPGRVLKDGKQRAERGRANLLPVALAAERRSVILTDSHEFATARLA